jgi:hypothetical protein
LPRILACRQCIVPEADAWAGRALDVRAGGMLCGRARHIFVPAPSGAWGRRTEADMPEYDSFLLRVWRSKRHDGWMWGLRLEHLQRGARQQFDDPTALVDALWALAEASPRAETEPPETKRDGGSAR